MFAIFQSSLASGLQPELRLASLYSHTSLSLWALPFTHGDNAQPQWGCGDQEIVTSAPADRRDLEEKSQGCSTLRPLLAVAQATPSWPLLFSDYGKTGLTQSLREERLEGREISSLLEESKRVSDHEWDQPESKFSISHMVMYMFQC